MHLSDLTRPFRYFGRGWRDLCDNRGRATGDRRLLFIRHPLFARYYYRTLLQWLAAEFPEVHAACEVRSLPFRLGEANRYAVAMSWIGDSCLAAGSWELAAMNELGASLGAAGIGLVNPLASTLRCSKHEGGRAMAQLGLHVPRSRLLTDRNAFQSDPGDFPFPLLIRENFGHAGLNTILKVEEPAELRAADLSGFRHPVAVEFVDIRDDAGLCCRYRYMGISDVGNSFNLHYSANWEVRGKCRVTNDATVKAEREFIGRPNPHHEEFQQVRKAMQLDLVGFDYSYDRHGRMVVWEANSLPGVTYVKTEKRNYLNANSKHVFAAMTKMLLERGGLPVPQRIYDMLGAAPAMSFALPRAA